MIDRWSFALSERVIEPVQSGLGESGRKRGLFTLGVLDGVSGGIGARDGALLADLVEDHVDVAGERDERGDTGNHQGSGKLGERRGEERRGSCRTAACPG